MKSLMLKCLDCGRYTVLEECSKCGGKTVTVHPAKFSPDDKYSRYRSPLAYKSD